MLPDLIIIGAMKAGTTSLFRYLASSPDVSGSSIKETEFFATEQDFARGLDWYEGLFDADAPHAVEACPNYARRDQSPGVPERIKSIVPDVNLIYLLRDPIERSFSHYVHTYAYGQERRPFSDAIAAGAYIEPSRYHYQVQAYADHFPKEQLLLVESERLRSEPESVVGEIFDFAGIDTTFDADVLERQFHASSGKRRRSDFEIAVDRRLSNRYVRGAFSRLMRPFRVPFERPEITQRDRDVLKERLAGDVDALREWSGMEFSRWSL